MLLRPAARPAWMISTCGNEHQRPAPIHLRREVDVLDAELVPLVPAAGRFEHGPRQEYGRAHQHFHRAPPRRIERGAAVLEVRSTEQARPPEQADAVEQRRDRGAPPVRNLEHSVRAAQPRAEHPDRGVRLREVEELAQRVRRNERVVVKEEQEPAAGGGSSLVVRPCANPRFSALRISTTCGNSAATISAAPSVEPLSAITTSNDGALRLIGTASAGTGGATRRSSSSRCTRTRPARPDAQRGVRSSVR